MTTIPFTKGHGTGNDFVLIADPDGALELHADRVARLCDRREGIGADGLLRAVRSNHLDEGAAAAAAGAEWFMDYRNADGSVAEMCGNGIRVFGQFLLEIGALTLEVGASAAIGTRAGVRTLTRTATGWSADLGVVTVTPESPTEDDAPLVSASGLDVARPGLSVDVGNPHVVVALAGDDELARLDLHSAPRVDPAPEHGANVEFVVPSDPLVVDGVGSIRMRVHERGSGETRSCGTGAVAAAAATRYWAGSGAPDRWSVDVPGGTLGVSFRGDSAELAGPAVLVFTGEISTGEIGTGEISAEKDPLSSR